MKNITPIVLLLGAALVGAASGASLDRVALAKKQEALNAEYNLAKDAKFYFVFDVLGKKLELRVRGMVLRTWPIESMRFWGRPEFSGLVELVKKTTLRAPERIVIKPGESELKAPAPGTKPPEPGSAAAAADYDLEARELRDMPVRFSLDLSNGLHITVTSKTGGTLGLGERLKEAWRWYVSLPLRNLLGPGQNKSLSELEVVFADAKEPQSIYWHFFDGIKGIIQ
jgi:hypothetical protein